MFAVDFIDADGLRSLPTESFLLFNKGVTGVLFGSDVFEVDSFGLDDLRSFPAPTDMSTGSVVVSDGFVGGSIVSENMILNFVTESTFLSCLSRRRSRRCGRLCARG